MQNATLFLANAYGAHFPTVRIVSTVCWNNAGEQVACPSFHAILFAALFPFLLIGVFLTAVLVVVAMWRIFEKAGQPGWAALVPVYNLVIFLKVINKPLWWLALMVIPYVGAVVTLVMTFHLARAFGKGIGFTVGLILFPFIFYPILGFGRAQYVWPVK